MRNSFFDARNYFDQARIPEFPSVTITVPVAGRTDSQEQGIFVCEL